MISNARWQILAVQVMVGAAVAIALYLTGSIIYNIYFNNPPITLTSLDPPNLSIVCPGDDHPIHLHVSIGEPIIVIYYVSTMDITGFDNKIGTQRAWTDLLHPIVADFNTELPWTVPDLPPDKYLRVFAARNIVGHQKTVFLKTAYEIGAGCSPPHLIEPKS